MSPLNILKATVSWMKSNHKAIFVVLAGLVVFAVLNVLMLQTNYELWTNPKVGFYSAFHKGFQFSGFDGHTYIVVSKWRPLFTLFRHPLLAAFMWPLSTLNEWLKEPTGMNCAIIIVAIVWTLVSTCSWVLLHRLIHRVVGLGTWASLLLCAYFYGFAYVMMATFVPDHMILSMTLLLLTLWWACKAEKEGRTLAMRKALLLTFITTGISTTNCVKIWLIDMLSQWQLRTLKSMFLRSLCYLIPLALIAGAYVWQENTTQKEDASMAQRIVEKRKERDSKFAETIKKKEEKQSSREQNQSAGIKLFEWTDTSIDRIPLLVENIFGEGLILHEDHLMEDANVNRPVFVTYRHKWYYAIECAIVVMFLMGVWIARRERLMWMLIAVMAFDALLHLGFRFAASDVYIMTAHWGFIIPIATAYLLRSVRHDRLIFNGILTVVALLTAFLWLHNATLIAQHILG